MNEDLKWLAENVHEWNFDDESRLVKSKHDGEYFFLRFNSDRGYTRAQWQAARDELSDKPSWDDAPEWAQWLAQDEDGQWYSFDSQPLRSERRWHCNPCYRVGYGKVLGDWRDTLERRPEKHSVEPTEKVWRGPEDGLPPVGSCCEMRFASGVWQDVKIEHYTRDHVVFTDMSGRERVEYIRSFEFRPIRSEEDKAIEEMLEVAQHVDKPNLPAIYKLFARDLYRAGYRKQEAE